MKNLHVLPTADAVADRAAEMIIESAAAATRDRGRFVLALAGGSTPEKAYARLAQADYRDRIDWTKILVFMGDERFVPADDPRSNFGMARRALLEHVPIPAGNVFPVPTTLPTPDEAAAAYAATIAEALGAPANGPAPKFDLILLGLGDDGHTASLFPGMPALHEMGRWVVASPPGVLPPPVDRVTFTYPVLNAALKVLFLVTGEKKAKMLREVLAGGPAEVHPAAGVRPTDGELVWLADEPAAK